MTTNEYSANAALAAVPRESLTEAIERAAVELPDVDGAFLFDPEGTILASAGAEAANDAAVLALTNGVLQLADRATSDLGRGSLRHIAAQGHVGYVVASVLDSGHSLVLLGRKDARLGLLLHDLEWLGRRLEASLI